MLLSVVVPRWEWENGNVGGATIEGGADQRIGLAAFARPVRENGRTQERGSPFPHEGVFYCPALQKNEEGQLEKTQKDSLPTLPRSLSLSLPVAHASTPPLPYSLSGNCECRGQKSLPPSGWLFFSESLIHLHGAGRLDRRGAARRVESGQHAQTEGDHGNQKYI